MILIVSTGSRLANLLKSSPDYANRCIYADSYSAAIACAQEQKVRIAIVAQRVGDRHGFELLSHLQQHFPKLPTIFVADDSRKETIISAMRRGAKDFLESPVGLQSLIDSIRRVDATFLRDSEQRESAANHQFAVNKHTRSESNQQSHTKGKLNDLIEVFFFGTFRVVINGKSIDHWPSRKGKSLIAYLIYNESKAIFREMLIDLFWPKVFPESARNCLNVTVHHIRQIFQNTGMQSNVLLLSNDCYMVNPGLRITTDVKRFFVHWNRFRFMKIDNRPSPAVNELELAASIYQNDFMQDEIYEDWTTPERENLRENYLEVLETLSRIYSLNGKPKTAIEICKSILEKDDCREKVHRRLMLCYYRIGDRDHALRQFQKCTEILKRELEVGPSAITVDLYRKIRDDTLPIPRVP
jgi:DNA-binding SARP family transcriptional activator/FixJ family two-component response regulator